MPQDHAARFVTTLAQAVLREGEPDALARQAREALDGVFAAQKSLVLDVQFTGFTAKGQPVGGISPALLRGAGQLIMMRVSRVGFTPDVRDEDLAAFFDLAARGPGEIGAGGIVAAVREAAPAGIYVSTNGGETYRPAPVQRPAASPEPAEPAASEAPAVESQATAEPAPTSAPVGEAAPAAVDHPTPSPESTTPAAAAPEAAPDAEKVVSPVAPDAADDQGESSSDDEGPIADAVEAATQPAAVEAAREEPPAEPASAPPVATPPVAMPSAFAFDDVDEGLSFTDFEVLEAFPDAPAADAAPSAASAEAPVGGGGGDATGGDLYHFFRASHAQVDPEAAELPELLHRAESLNQFDEVAQGCARAAARLVATGHPTAALDVLEALMREAERPDRSRVFREGAVQALRRAGTEQTLHAFVDHMQRHTGDADRVVRIFLFLGGDGVGLLDGILFRTGDPDLRSVLFRRLVSHEGGSPRLLARTMADPAPGRTRALLELAATSGLEQETALRWITEAATHPDSTVRMDAARHASAQGRGGLRVLVDLLGDADRLVKRATIQGLGTLGDAAAVPFLARLLNDTGDEDVQMAVIGALGKIASPDALPTLVNVVNKRQLFAGKKLVRVKIAALSAISRLPGAAAREVLTTVSNGKDAELAPEARRILALVD